MTYTYDQTRISFLDLWISVSGHGISTCTFRKDTSANTLLQANSHHPRWLKDSVTVGQFLHIMCNCNEQIEYRRESKDLYGRFRERGYAVNLGGQRIRWQNAIGRIFWKAHPEMYQQGNLGQGIQGSIQVITHYGTQWDTNIFVFWYSDQCPGIGQNSRPISQDDG